MVMDIKIEELFYKKKINYNIIKIILKKLDKIYLNEWKIKITKVNEQYDKCFFIKSYGLDNGTLYKGKILTIYGLPFYKYYEDIPFNYRELSDPSSIVTDIYHDDKCVGQLPSHYLYSY